MVLECKKSGSFANLFDANIFVSFYIDALESPYNSSAVVDLLEPRSDSLQGIYRFYKNPDSQRDFVSRMLEKARKRMSIKTPKYKLSPSSPRCDLSSYTVNIEKDNIFSLGQIGHVYASKSMKDLKSDIMLEKGDILEIRGKLMSYGKGFSKEESEFSAYFELIEHLKSMIFTDKRHFYEYSVKELKNMGAKYVDPSDFTNCLAPPMNNEKIEWVKATEMITGEEHLIPAGVIYFLLFPKEGLYYPFVGNSVGLAAGVDEEAAVKHALYEIMEKDSLTTSFYYANIDSDSFPKDIRETIEELILRGLTVDISIGHNDMPPYFINTSLKAEKYNQVFVYEGSRYNPDPEKAVKGALSEAVMAYVENGMPEFSEKGRNVKGLDFQKLTPYGENNALEFFEKTKIPVYSFTINKKPYIARVISPNLCVGGEFLDEFERSF